MSGSGAHSNQDEDDGTHVPTTWTYANAATRAAHTPTKGPHLNPEDLTSPFRPMLVTDEGKFARQLDNDTIWMLVAFAGPTWVPITAQAGVVALFVKSDLEMTTTGVTPISKVQLNTLALFGGNIPIGTYKLDGSFTWRRASVSGDAALALVEDIAGAGNVLWAKEKENQDASANQRSAASVTDEFVVGAAGDFTFDLTFANVAGFGGVTVGMQQARLWLVRVKV